MKNYYTTSEVAKIIGIHPNTVRLYEELGLIPTPKRMSNGYRIFTKLHIDQFKIARAAFQVEILQNGLRKTAVEIIKTSATGNFDKALELTEKYLKQINSEKRNAEEAISIAEGILSQSNKEINNMYLTRKQAADYLDITIDTLRNWELNGLLTIKRKHNGYRVYTDEDIQILKIIRSLRCANYSLASILRMLNGISTNPQSDIRAIIDTPRDNDDIISVCDKLLSSLNHTKTNAEYMYSHLKEMKNEYNSTPPL